VSGLKRLKTKLLQNHCIYIYIDKRQLSQQQQEQSQDSTKQEHKDLENNNILSAFSFQK